MARLGESAPPLPGTHDVAVLRELRDYRRFEAVLAGRLATGRLRAALARLFARRPPPPPPARLPLSGRGAGPTGYGSRRTKSATAAAYVLGGPRQARRVHRDLGEGEAGGPEGLANQRRNRQTPLSSACGQRGRAEHVGVVRQPHLELVGVRRLGMDAEPRHARRREALRASPRPRPWRGPRTRAVRAAPCAARAGPRGRRGTAGRAGRRSGAARCGPARSATPGPRGPRPTDRPASCRTTRTRCPRGPRSRAASGRSARSSPRAWRRRSAPRRRARGPRRPRRPVRPRSAGRSRRRAAEAPASGWRRAPRSRVPRPRSAVAAPPSGGPCATR